MPKTSDTLSENRSFPRVAGNCRLRFKTVGNEPAFRNLAQNSGMMKNISGGGICFDSTDPIAPGTMLAIEVDLPGFPTSVIALGRVVRCDPSGARHDIGLEFWWIGWRDEAAQNMIRQFIAAQLRGVEG